MGVKILSEQYRDVFRSQDLNINWLIGNVGTWQKFKINVEFDVAIAFTSNNPLFMEEPNVFCLTDGTTWEDNGFSIGDSFKMQWASTDIDTKVISYYTVTGTITDIKGDKMFSSNNGFGGGALVSNIYPVQLADEKIHSVFISTDKRPQGIKFKYNHTKNSLVSSLDFNSFIDGSVTEFLAEDTDLMTINQLIPMEQIGLKSGMSVAFCYLIYNGNNSSRYSYSIIISYMISSFFNDLLNFENNVSPEETLGDECLTDVYEITGYPVYNNPNIKIQSKPRETAQLGNTGWFDENFNGLKNSFTVESIEYRNQNGTIVNQLDHKNTTSFRAVINGVPNTTGLTKCSYGFIWIPTDETVYKSNNNQFHENLRVSTGGFALGFGDAFTVSNTILNNTYEGYSFDDAKMNVTNIRFQSTGATQITFECDFVPTAEFAAMFEALDVTERNYCLWVSVADQNKITNKSDRVSLKLDFNQMDTYIEPVGEYEGMNISFLEHPQDEDGTVSLCGNDIKIEDDLLARIEFLVDTDVSPTVPIPTGLEYGFLIENLTDGTQYKLDSYNIDLTQYPSVSQYNFNQTRGFKLEAGNNKNFVKANYYPALDSGTKLGVLGLYGFKVRWEDWITRLNVPTTIYNDYYDSSLLSNGLSNDWYRYLLDSNYQMNFYVLTSAILDGQSVVYENKKPLVFQDYDSNSNITTTVTYKRESDGTILSGGADPISGLPLGVILENENVLLEIEYTRLVGTWSSVSEIYGVSSIGVYQGAGQFEYRQLSSVWGSELDNPLIPISGATKLDLTLVSPTVLRASCLINPNKLTKAPRYKITGREGCK